MDSFDIAQKFDELEQTQLEIIHLKNAIASAFCPYKRQYLETHLFRQINHTIKITDELYRYFQEDIIKTKSTSRQTTEFTISELSNFNGTGGKPAYVAVNGVVYDVSNEATWGGSSHFGLIAGKDLTDEFNKCHGMISVLSNLPKVGTIK